MRTVAAHVGRLVCLFLITSLAASSAGAHPGSGIVIDRRGQVYFVDTGFGVWKIDARGRLIPHEGPAYHWMAIDRVGRSRRLPAELASGALSVVGSDPSLILSSDYPVTAGSDGAFYYPEAGGDRRVHLMRLDRSGARTVFAALPAATEIGEDGQIVRAQWIHGLAAGRDGSLYYTERHAVRRIAPGGSVSLVADNIAVPDCVRPPALAGEERIVPGLRGLDVAGDGTVYVAASACSALLKVTPAGRISVVLRGSDAWSPMGVAVSGGDLYVLEYRYIAAGAREEWLPRVRRVSRDGRVTVMAVVDHRRRNQSRVTGGRLGLLQSAVSPKPLVINYRASRNLISSDRPRYRRISTREEYPGWDTSP